MKEKRKGAEKRIKKSDEKTELYMRAMILTIRDIFWFIFIYPILFFRCRYYEHKTKILSQKNRLALYRKYPPIPYDIGIGFKNGRFYDYIYKEYIK